MNRPKLRPLDFQPITYQGQQMWLLRDPLGLSEQQLIIPSSLAQMLLYCNGLYTPEQIHVAFCRHTGDNVPLAVIEDALAQLDGAFLLENPRAAQAQVAQREAYRAQPHRPPALAKVSYPDNPQRLARQLARYGDDDDRANWQPWRGRAIVSPHIDYQRGGPVYAKVWERAETAVLEADLVLIFGTDHNGGRSTFTLTQLPYATPFGVLPTDAPLINAVAEAIGPDEAYAEELHHRKEHAIELSAVWLHYIYHKHGVAPKPMVPILCGSFHHFVRNGGHPANDELLMTAVETLRRQTAGKKVLAVASVDFAHVGPAFDDNYSMDSQRRTTLRQTDDQLIEAVLRGDAADFYRQIASVEDRNKVCGFAPIYLMLRYLEATNNGHVTGSSQATGHKVAYDHCPADAEDHSLVSISGLLIN
jgi:AmmeMemoRadiSam system protein B